MSNFANSSQNLLADCLGAERPRHEFTQAEDDSIVTAFDYVQDAAGFTCTRVGVGGWTAGR